MQDNSFPLVSIVFPVANNEATIEKAFLSIINQTYKKIEIIIVDLGSLDKSFSIIESIINKSTILHKSIFFINDKPYSFIEGLNHGFKKAKGRWLTSLQAEDYFHLNRIMSLVTYLSAAKAEIAFSYISALDNNKSSDKKAVFLQKIENSFFNLFNSSLSIGFQLFQDNLAVTVGNLIFSRTLYEKIGLFKNLEIESARDFLLRSLIYTEPVLVREVLYYYNINSYFFLLNQRDLQENEISSVYLSYLINTSVALPLNKKAPCYAYFPSEFSELCIKLNIDKGLMSFIVQDRTNKPSATNKSFNPCIAVDPKRKKRDITLISHELSLTGAPKLIVDIAISLKNHGYNPRIITIYEGPMRRELEKYDIPIHSIYAKIDPHRRLRIKFLCSILYAICFKIKGTVIGNSIATFPIMFPLAILRPWSQPIWYIHESITIFGILQKPWIKKTVDFLIPIIKKINPPMMWYGSKATSDIWKDFTFGQRQVVYWSGIRQQNIERKEKKQLKNLLSVGTASFRKGTHTLINAFLHCLEKKLIPKDVTLTIVGFSKTLNAEFNSLRSTILKVITSPYKDNIKMVESIDPEKLDLYYNAADIYIQSSVSECLPIALVSAMSRGLPIITTNVDGCVELIEDDDSGYLCFPYDENSLADAIIKMITFPEKSQRMGESARAVFNKNYSLEITEESLIEKLSSIHK